MAKNLHIYCISKEFNYQQDKRRNPTYIIIKPSKTKAKGDLESTKGKVTRLTQGSLIRLAISETTEVRRSWSDILNMLKENCQPRVLYLTNYSSNYIPR
jgi:hypothetical protein